MEFTSVGRQDEFADGVIRSFDVDGVDVAVVSWRDRFYAFGNKCTHWGISLAAEGYITKDNEIVCWFHGACFEMATGAYIDGPGRRDLPAYEVRLAGDDVQVRAVAS